MTRGIVVPNMPCMRNMEPISPGTRIVEKVTPPAAPAAAPVEKPLPILGST